MKNSQVLNAEKLTHDCLSVVMPAYNEEATLTQIVQQVLQIPQLLELIIVDDCSKDNTPQIAESLVAHAG